MAAQSEYDEFVKDDYEFRTITTLLNTLGSRERVTPENFNAVPKMKPYLKFLSALSSLLVREREIVAILPKRSSSGVSLLIGFEESPFDREEDLPSPPPSPSSPPGRRLQHYITRNPRADDELGGGIRLSEQSPVTVGSNVDDFIIKHWYLCIIPDEFPWASTKQLASMLQESNVRTPHPSLRRPPKCGIQESRSHNEERAKTLFNVSIGSQNSSEV